jgi:hypothetical protein
MRKASNIPYTGSRLKLRLTVKGEMLDKALTERLKAKTVQKRLSTINQIKSIKLGKIALTGIN